MAKSPRSLHTISLYYNPRTPEGQKIKTWIMQQSNLTESLREIICLYGEQYNQYRKEHPKEEKISLYQKRRLSGLCVRCGKSANGNSRCRECLDKLLKKN